MLRIVCGRIEWRRFHSYSRLTQLHYGVHAAGQVLKLLHIHLCTKPKLGPADFQQLYSRLLLRQARTCLYFTTSIDNSVGVDNTAMRDIVQYCGPVWCWTSLTSLIASHWVFIVNFAPCFSEDLGFSEAWNLAFTGTSNCPPHPPCQWQIEWKCKHHIDKSL